ncbi:MAG: ABC transporter permease [Christensenellales bacterium]|jgi:putative aldouronate transport system permease protein
MQTTIRSKKKSFIRYFRSNWALYLLSIPGLIYIIGYKILPLVGLQLAFKEFDMFAGKNILDSIFKSEWVGLEHFVRIFGSPNFIHLLTNTLTISVMKLVFTFPLPILLALMLNEVRNRFFARTVQTLVYMPHFLSWVIIHGIFVTLLSSNGFVNRALNTEIGFYTDPQIFRWLLVLTVGWKETGWGAIVYLAALTSIDEELYDAAYVDGAGYFKRLWHITLPSIIPIISLMLLLRLGGILGAGHEQILVMYNSTVYSTADVLSTYIYRIGMGKLDFSTATALGLFESLVGFVLMVVCNMVSRKILERSLW